MTKPFEIDPCPETEKDGLLNIIKRMFNETLNGRTDAMKVVEIQYQLTDLIDSLSSKRVQFSWNDEKLTPEEEAEERRKMVAEYAAENPEMVD